MELIQINYSNEKPAYIDRVIDCVPFYPSSKIPDGYMKQSSMITNAMTAFPLATAYGKYVENKINDDAILFKNECTNCDLHCVSLGRDQICDSWL